MLQDSIGAAAKGASSLHDQFIVLVPCLEMAIGKLRELARLVQKIQEDELFDPAGCAEPDIVVSGAGLLEEAGRADASRMQSEAPGDDDGGAAEEDGRSTADGGQGEHNTQSSARDADLEGAADDAQESRKSSKSSSATRQSASTKPARRLKTQKLTPKSKPKR
eukprot:gb/GFBE01001464.1/.p1 GENE.gb/GFBE01001464.1/~~gb/GFBE01001464.1/.p1  ORF type:complete len:164 (+),score=36.78 gb/GFBE01001464.1/:1-492(+)